MSHGNYGRNARVLAVRGIPSGCLCLLLVVAAGLLRAADLPNAKPEDVGMSSERLKRIDEAMKRHIDAGDIQGAVTAVARRGKVVHFESHGLMDVDAKKPMAKDAIFRMASSSKPVTCVAIMMLVEEGKVRPSDPVNKFIPEFKNMKVAVAKGNEVTRAARGSTADYELVPAERDITIHDLLTHTSGLLSGGLGATIAGPQARWGADDTLSDFIPRLAKFPLDFQPGSRWKYSGLAGLDTLGRVVEVASGQTFDQFLKQRIFDPLGMKDTAFVLSEDRRSRLVKMAGRPAAADALPMTRKFFSGGGGLLSTAEDYLRFEMMLTGGGQLFGTRILSPRTVEMMGSNHAGDMYTGLPGPGRGRLNPVVDGLGFGYTVYVVRDAIKADSRRSNGAFGWGGAFGTITWTDPKEQLSGVLMLQQRHPQTDDDFENAVRQAITE